MCDSLGKTFLLPSWFAEDFKDEPFASLLEIFFFNVQDSPRKNLLLPHGGCFRCT